MTLQGLKDVATQFKDKNSIGGNREQVVVATSGKNIGKIFELRNQTA